MRPESDKDTYGKGHMDGMKHGYLSGRRVGMQAGYMIGTTLGVGLTLFVCWLVS